jgi:hypothetical protein
MFQNAALMSEDAQVGEASGEQFQETDEDMNNHDHELYQNKQGDEDQDECAQSTPSKASDAVSHSIIGLSSVFLSFYRP